MTKGEKQHLAFWFVHVYEESQRLADIADPKRKRNNETVNRLDNITHQASDGYLYLTGDTILKQTDRRER